MVTGEFHAECCRFGVNAVAAADGRGQLVLEGALLQRHQDPIDAGQQQVRRVHQLDIEARIQHIRRGHALVQEAGFVTDMLGHIGEEGDDVVLYFALDFINPVDVERGALTDCG